MKDKKLTEITEHYLKMSKGGVGVFPGSKSVQPGTAL